MATLNLNTLEFENLVLLFLFDFVMNKEQAQNDIMKEFIDSYGTKIKSGLMKSYFESDSEMRLNYRRINGIFDGSDKSIQQIRIGPNNKIKQITKGKENIVKKVIKKILKKEELSIEEINMLKEEIENVKES